eukprot:10059390-Alexandrium_andersonii.AAC.1
MSLNGPGGGQRAISECVEHPWQAQTSAPVSARPTCLDESQHVLRWRAIQPHLTWQTQKPPGATSSVINDPQSGDGPL